MSCRRFGALLADERASVESASGKVREAFDALRPRLTLDGRKHCVEQVRPGISG